MLCEHITIYYGPVSTPSPHLNVRIRFLHVRASWKSGTPTEPNHCFPILLWRPCGGKLGPGATCHKGVASTLILTVKTEGILLPGSATGLRHLARALYQHRKNPYIAYSRAVWGILKVCKSLPYHYAQSPISQILVFWSSRIAHVVSF